MDIFCVEFGFYFLTVGLENCFSVRVTSASAAVLRPLSFAALCHFEAISLFTGRILSQLASLHKVFYPLGREIAAFLLISTEP